MPAIISSKHHVVRYDQALIRFQVYYSRRKTLAVQVHRDGNVVVRAPQHTPLWEIEQQVSQRGSWILQHQQRFARLPTITPCQYRSGEIFYYLGQPLSLVLQAGQKNHVCLVQDQLLVTTSAVNEQQRLKQQLKNWYKQQARQVFGERFSRCIKQVADYGIPAPQTWQLRWMKRRWGSCSSTGKITLNTALIAAPEPCIDYVIIHELCHLLEHNHSPAYYRLLTQVLPDWQQQRQRLNSASGLNF